MNNPHSDSLSQALLAICDRLASDCNRLSFNPPVAYVYNPLIYARPAFRIYLERFFKQRGTILMAGMNPGPFGMAQTGIPFGDIPSVRDWMGINCIIGQPEHQHPKRPIQGFDCPRIEASGKRLWGFFAHLYPQPEDFFSRCSVVNYCPLVFMDQGGANITPDKLQKIDREQLFAICDQALVQIIDVLQPRALVGVGAFAHHHLGIAAQLLGEPVSLRPCISITHPSPANPRANKGWSADVSNSLQAYGLWPL